MNSEKMTNTRRAMRWGLTCDKGQCQEKVSKNGKEIIEICKFKPTIKQVEENKYEPNSCHYYLQKYDALVSKHSLWNYHAYFQIMQFNKLIVLVDKVYFFISVVVFSSQRSKSSL